MKKLLASLILPPLFIVGPAMAWVPSGTGGQVALSGKLTPPGGGENTPWEVFTGDAVSGLNADVTGGAETVLISLPRTVPVLGIRTQTSDPFYGQAGISPQIDYQGHVDLNNFINGVSILTLDVMAADNPAFRIGTLTVPFTAAAAGSVKNSVDIADRYSPLVATRAGQGFWGGVGKTRAQVAGNSRELAMRLAPDIIANFNDQDLDYESTDWWDTTFASAGATYSAYYGSGLLDGAIVLITLDAPATGVRRIPWKATLPVTVNYM